MEYLNIQIEFVEPVLTSAIRQKLFSPLALDRKNFLFAGSHDAAQNIAMFYSFLGTCKKLDIDPQNG
jgi:transposase